MERGGKVVAESAKESWCHKQAQPNLSIKIWLEAGLKNRKILKESENTPSEELWNIGGKDQQKCAHQRIELGSQKMTNCASSVKKNNRTIKLLSDSCWQEY